MQKIQFWEGNLIRTSYLLKALKSVFPIVMNEQPILSIGNFIEKNRDMEL